MQDCDKVESNSNLSGGVCCNSGDRIPAVMLLRDRVYVFSQLGGDGNKRMGNRLYTRGKPVILHCFYLFASVTFLAATAALEVQMLVCVSVCPSHLLQLYWTSEGLLKDL